MRKFIIRFLISSAALILTFGGAANAAVNLTLDGAMKDAESNSPALQAAAAAAEGARWKKIEGYSQFLPSVNVQAMRVLDYKYQFFDVSLGGPTLAFPEIVPNSAASLNAYLPIFDGFSNLRRYEAGSDLEKAAVHDLNWAKFQLDQDVKAKFYEALAAVKLLDVARENVKTLEDHLERTQVQKRGGVSTQFDVLRVQVQLSDAKAEEIQAEDNVEIAKKFLSEAMGLDSDNREVAGDLPTPVIGLVQDLKFNETAQREDVQALLARDQATLDMSKSADVYWVPKIGLSYQYTYYNNRDNSFFDPTPYRNAWQLGLTLTWNLFDGMASIAHAHEADADYTRSQKSVRQALLHIPVQFENWKKKFSTASVNYQAKVLNVSRAQESVRLAQQGYRAGTRINSEVLDAELDLFRARAGVVSTQLSAEQALINLESVIGRRIDSGK